MNIIFPSQVVKNIIFVYDKNAYIDVLKYIKVFIHNDKVIFVNLHQNNFIYNEINIENQEYVGEFVCNIEELKNLFSVVPEGTNLVITKITQEFIYFENDGSIFKIPQVEDDFGYIPDNYAKYDYQINISNNYDEIKNIIVKSKDNLSKYIVFKVQEQELYILSTDNYRIHSIKLNEKVNLPNNYFIVPVNFIELIGRYNLNICVAQNNYLLKNEYTTIVLKQPTEQKIFKKAFYYLDKIQEQDYLNKFTVNKLTILEELKKHSIFSKDIYIHVKQKNVIFYSKHDKIHKSDIKTSSHAYNLDFNEHQTILIDLKYFIDFIKAHNYNTINIHLSKSNYIYSESNLCAIKRM